MPGISRPMANRRTKRGSKGGGGGDFTADYAWKIGRWVAHHREKVGLLQSEVAKACDVSPQFMSKLERGQSSIPPERYKEFVETLNLTPREAGMFLLEFTNPYLFELIFGKGDGARLENLPNRVGPERWAEDQP